MRPACDIHTVACLQAQLRATAIARALYAALHVVVLGTLFACDAHLSHAWEQRHWLYAICFVGLNICCVAMFVALSMMDPGFLQPNQRVWGACKPEPKQVIKQQACIAQIHYFSDGRCRMVVWALCRCRKVVCAQLPGRTQAH